MPALCQPLGDGPLGKKRYLLFLDRRRVGGWHPHWTTLSPPCPYSACSLSRWPFWCG